MRFEAIEAVGAWENVAIEALRAAKKNDIKAASAGPHRNVEDLRPCSSPRQADDPKGECAGHRESKRFVPVPRLRIQLTAFQPSI